MITVGRMINTIGFPDWPPICKPRSGCNCDNRRKRGVTGREGCEKNSGRFTVVLDPVKAGFVASLNHPGGNATEVVTLNVDTGRKRLELLHEVVPAATTLVFLLNPTNKMVAEVQTNDRRQTGASALGIQLRLLNGASAGDFEDVFASLKQMQVGGLVIGTDGFFVSESERLAALSGHNAMPAIFQYRAFAAAGGLMSYGSSVTALNDCPVFKPAASSKARSEPIAGPTVHKI